MKAMCLVHDPIPQRTQARSELCLEIHDSLISIDKCFKSVARIEVDTVKSFTIQHRLTSTRLDAILLTAAK